MKAKLILDQKIHISLRKSNNLILNILEKKKDNLLIALPQDNAKTHDAFTFIGLVHSFTKNIKDVC